MQHNFQEKKNNVITFCKEHKNEIFIGSALGATIILLYLEKNANSKKSTIISKQALEIIDLKRKNSILTDKLLKLDKQNATVSSEALRLHSSIGGKMMAERRYAPLV